MAISVGKKTALPMAIRFIKSPKKGTLGLEIMFEFLEGATQERMAFVTWLSEAALDRSMDMLVNTLGYNGSEVTDSNGILTDPNVINFKRQVSLTVEIESYTNDQGKTFSKPKIKYVNPIAGSGFADLSPQIIKNDLANGKFKAMFLKHKKSNPNGQIPF